MIPQYFPYQDDYQFFMNMPPSPEFLGGQYPQDLAQRPSEQRQGTPEQMSEVPEIARQHRPPSPAEPPQRSRTPEQMNEVPEIARQRRPPSPADPPPILSNNPATTSITLFKELTGFPNYGNPSRNADILYTGNRGTWTFESPAFLFVPGNLRAQLRIRAVLDDHSSVPAGRYSARISFNGNVIHNGALALAHGSPAGGMFTNWRELPFNVTNLRRLNRVEIVNTSTAGPDDWIGLDWMEIRLSPR